MYRHSQQLGLQSHSKSKRKRKKDMTVCIAAMYDKGIVLVTDTKRTDTATERSHESQQSKIVLLSRNIFALIADDMALQLEICETTVRDLHQRFPKGDCKVKDAVEAYDAAYVIAKQDRILTNILGDYGYKTFEEYRQDSRSEALDKEIFRRIEQFELPGTIETIIAGFDEHGKHIWLITPDDLQKSCADDGFVSIGQGVKEVEYQFHKLEYDRGISLDDAMFTAFTAKARAEDFLGVGAVTAIAHLDGNGLKYMPPFAVMEIDTLYQAMEMSIRKTERCGKQLVGKSTIMPEPKNNRGRSQGRSSQRKDSRSDDSLTKQSFLEHLKQVSRPLSPSDSETKETSARPNGDDCSETHTR